MLDTDRSERQTLVDLLADLVGDCCRCSDEFYSNVALIADADGNLTNEQLKACTKHLTEGHAKHVH